jgi:hypothetical protein
MALNRTLYALFVGLIAGSPILSFVISDAILGEISFGKFLWVGVLLSLPVPLIAARAFGQQTYLGFWAYLESFPPKNGLPANTQRTTIIAWAAATAITLLIGIASVWL